MGFLLLLLLRSHMVYGAPIMQQTQQHSLIERTYFIGVGGWCWVEVVGVDFE